MMIWNKKNFSLYGLYKIFQRFNLVKRRSFTLIQSLHIVWYHGYIIRPLGYERVYLPLCEVADTPFHNQGDEYKL